MILVRLGSCYNTVSLRSASASSYTKRLNGIRPSLDDVERISRGQAAKKRGVGSRAVPHRLNEAERKEWDLAKTRKFVSLRGTGWRKERGDSPLANIYRNYCDATAIPCISIIRGVGVGEESMDDQVIVDFSPLRTSDVQEQAKVCIEQAQAFESISNVEDNSNVDQLGWDMTNIETVMLDEAIWRIPVYSVVASFSSRADCKKYAEAIAGKFANVVSGGKKAKRAESEPV